MTDKQIIIDGVPVQDCCYFDYENDGYEDSCYIHQNECSAQNCYYKQLKAKEQECEELKKIINEAKNSKLDLKSFLVGEAIQNEYEQQLDQLKGENEKYSLFIEKLCDYAGLECDSEEQAMRTLSDLASQMNKARWIIDRYKQTLTEIKEIAEKTLNMVDYKTYFKRDNKSLKQEGFKALNEILQKINEVINEHNG